MDYMQSNWQGNNLGNLWIPQIKCTDCLKGPGIGGQAGNGGTGIGVNGGKGYGGNGGSVFGNGNGIAGNGGDGIAWGNGVGYGGHGGNAGEAGKWRTERSTYTQSGIVGALKHGGTKRNLNPHSGGREGGGLSMVP